MAFTKENRKRGARKPKSKENKQNLEFQTQAQQENNNYHHSEGVRAERLQERPTERKYESDSVGNGEGGYVPPPMEDGPLFIIDERGMRFEGENPNDDRPEGIHPASYGLVNPELQSYLRNCEETLDSGELASEDVEMFIERIQEEIREKELLLMTDHNCSVILEKLLSYSNKEYLCHMLSQIRGQEIQLMIHRFGSHVLQTLFTLIGKFIDAERTRGAEKAIIKISENIEDEKVEREVGFEDFVISFSSIITKYFEFLVMNSFGSHVVRAFLYVLSGKQVLESSGSKGNMRSKKSAEFSNSRNKPVTAGSKNQVNFAVPDSFKSCLLDLLRESSVLGQESFAFKCALDPVASPTLQVIIQLSAELKIAETPGLVLDQLLLGLVSEQNLDKESDAKDDENDTQTIAEKQSNRIKMLVYDMYGSRLFEKIIEIASPSLFQKIYVSGIRNNLADLIMDINANFVVQSFIKKILNGSLLESVLDEIVLNFGQVFYNNRLGVVSALGSACLSCRTGYKTLMQNLIKVFCGSSKDLVNDLAVNIGINNYVKTEESEMIKKDDPSTKVNVQSGLILGSLFNFPNEHIKPLIKSFISIPYDPTFLKLCKEPIGSRVVESFLKANFDSVPIKNKRKILLKLESHYAEMAMDKFSSHVVDHCWNLADLKLKEQIADEFIANKEAVKNSFFGKYVWQNCNIDLYLYKSDSWKAQQETSRKKKELFSSILGLELVQKKNLGNDNDSSSDDDTTNLGVDSDEDGDGDAMKLLGFSKSKSKKSDSKDSRSKDKSKKRSKKYETDEIDILFKKSKKTKSSNESVPQEPVSAVPEAKAEAKTKKSQKASDKAQDESLNAVLDAIKNTKKKKTSTATKNKMSTTIASSSSNRQKLSKKERELESKSRRKFF